MAARTVLCVVRTDGVLGSHQSMTHSGIPSSLIQMPLCVLSSPLLFKSFQIFYLQLPVPYYAGADRPRISLA